MAHRSDQLRRNYDHRNANLPHVEDAHIAHEFARNQRITLMFLLVARCALFLVCVFCLFQFYGDFVENLEVVLCTEIGIVWTICLGLIENCLEAHGTGDLQMNGLTGALAIRINLLCSKCRVGHAVSLRDVDERRVE